MPEDGSKRSLRVQPAVDHNMHAFDRKARLSDVCRKHDFSMVWRGQNRPFLLLEGKIAVERMQGKAFLVKFSDSESRLLQARISPAPGRKARISPFVSRNAVLTAVAIRTGSDPGRPQESALPREMPYLRN